MLKTRASSFYLLYRQSDYPEISSLWMEEWCRSPLRELQRQGWYFLNPARCIPRLAASFFMNVFQTNPDR